MFDVLILEELLEAFCSEGRAVVYVDDTGGSILGDEFSELLGKGKG